MHNTDMKALKSHISNMNQNFGNHVMESEFITNKTFSHGNHFEDLGSPFADTFYVINLTGYPIAYCREDGVVVQLSENNLVNISAKMADEFRGKIIVVNTRRAEFVNFDKTIGQKVGGVTRTNSFAARKYRSFINENTARPTYSFPYQEDMEKLINLTLNELDFGDSRDIDRIDTAIQCKTIYVIDPNGIHPEKDTYVEYVNMVFRKLHQEEIEESPHGSRYIRKHTVIVDNRKPMVHPMAPANFMAFLTNISAAHRETVHMQMMEVNYWKCSTDRDTVFMIRDNQIVELPVRKVETADEEGLIVYSKDEYGQLQHTCHALSELPRFNIYKTREEAEQILFGVSRRNEEIDSLEKQKKQLEDEIAKLKKEADATKNAKNEINTKSDELKLVGQIIGVVAAVAGAIVGLIKLFSPSRFFSGLFSFGSAT